MNQPFDQNDALSEEKITQLVDLGRAIMKLLNGVDARISEHVLFSCITTIYAKEVPNDRVASLRVMQHIERLKWFMNETIKNLKRCQNEE